VKDLKVYLYACANDSNGYHCNEEALGEKNGYDLPMIKAETGFIILMKIYLLAFINYKPS
jgi:hypothetical protein